VEAYPRKLKNYLSVDGKDPFNIWLTCLRDTKGRNVIKIRLNRVERGNYGDHSPVGEGVQELRIDFGPGYRVYFGEDGDDVILLGGGDKSTQSVDIAKARERWSDYNA
jgi:putative addiction module killer protein